MRSRSLVSVWAGLLTLVVVVASFSQAQKSTAEGGQGASFFKEDSKSFVGKTPAGPSDWLANHRESGQTFRQYLRSQPNLPDQRRKVLYVLPLGDFEEGAPDLSALDDYMKAYFHPMQIKIMDRVTDEKVLAKSRVNRGAKQWNTMDVLKWMQLPDDAYAMIAVTMTDLYPDEKWNYVFGMASLRNRVGVFSFARYSDEDDKRVLLRAAKVLTHEMGHMFGIKHCIAFQCNMNGANHLLEVDQSPPHLCPVCLRKLHHAVKFDPRKRYERLLNYYEDHSLQEQADWTRLRLGLEVSE